MQNNNHVYIEMEAKSCNEAFARVCVAAFCTRLDPTLEEISDIKTAVSEAVTNAIVHGYKKNGGTVRMDCEIEDRDITIIISDDGCGIEDINKAMEPLFTTASEDERSGMGFTFMEVFMDSLEVISELGKGTKVIMKKRIEKK